MINAKRKSKADHLAATFKSKYKPGPKAVNHHRTGGSEVGLKKRCT